MTLYIGPGLGLATIIVIVIILLIVGFSLFVVLSRPIKRLFKKKKKSLDDG